MAHLAQHPAIGAGNALNGQHAAIGVGFKIPPNAEKAAEEICLEADGTYIPLQTGGSVEVKACVAYAGKTQGERVERIDPVRHGCVGKSAEFWPQAIGVIGQRFDLSRIEKCHAGFDGESWCKRGGDYLPVAIKTDGNLDAFHVNRSIAACFPKEQTDAKYQVLDCVWYGRADDAAEMLEYYKSEGLTKEGDIVEKVTKYLRNNAEFICANPPSLGTMEAENEHLYASRMKSVPCAWSVQGVSDMARLHSRKFSGREMLCPTREDSLGGNRGSLTRNKFTPTLPIRGLRGNRVSGRIRVSWTGRLRPGSTLGWGSPQPLFYPRAGQSDGRS